MAWMAHGPEVSAVQPAMRCLPYGHDMVDMTGRRSAFDALRIGRQVVGPHRRPLPVVTACRRARSSCVDGLLPVLGPPLLAGALGAFRHGIAARTYACWHGVLLNRGEGGGPTPPSMRQPPRRRLPMRSRLSDQCGRAATAALSVRRRQERCRPKPWFRLPAGRAGRRERQRHPGRSTCRRLW